MFFNYPKMHCVTAILLVLKLPSFDTVVYSFYRQWTGSVNSVVQYLSSVFLYSFFFTSMDLLCLK